MDSNDCGFVFMSWRLAAAPENCRRPQPAPTRLHAQQKESLTLVANRNSVAELVAFVRFPLWRSHIVSPLSLHRSRLDDPLR
jgi:ABC-type molybdate transport system substrate-binding protein